MAVSNYNRISNSALADFVCRTDPYAVVWKNVIREELGQLRKPANTALSRLACEAFKEAH